MHAAPGHNSGQGPRRRPWWALDARRVLVLALFLALFAMSARATVDPDLWWHLATGRAIVETRSIPRHDLFSYTVPDHEWVTHEWLAQVAMYGLYRVGGLPALLLATSAIVTVSFALVYVQCEGRPHLAVFGVLLGALVSAVTWGPRPQMLTMGLTAACTLLLNRYRAGRRWALWLYPALTALWVNLHSGFLVGPALLGLVLAGEGAAYLFDRRAPETLTARQMGELALALGASVLAALLNPNGLRILTYPFETLGSGAMQRYIQEWASPDFHRREYWPLALLYLGGSASLALSARRRSLTDVGLFYAFAMAALHAARHVPLYAVVATPIVTRYVVKRPPPRPSPANRPSMSASASVGGEGGETPSRPRPSAVGPGRIERGPPWLILLNWTLVLLLALGAGARVAWVLRDNREVEAERYPAAALAYLEANGLSGRRMYNSYNWGGYLLWRGYPVFIDGRADVYGDAFMDEYVLAYQLRGDWRRPLERYGVELVLIESGASLEALLSESDEWGRVYRDELAVVFVRQEGEAKPSP